MLSSALECTVAVFHATGHDEAAALLAGALGEGVATAVPRPMTGGLVADLGVAGTLQEVQAALGDDAFHDALGRGASMNLDETVAYVFSVLDVAALAVP